MALVYLLGQSRAVTASPLNCGVTVGYILAVDETAQLVDIQLPGDVAVAVSANLVTKQP